MYEKWLGQRTLEEPSIVRRIATALLREHAYTTQDERVRLEALRALASDGEQAALTALSRDSTGAAPHRVLAALGDERAVKALATSLTQGDRQHRRDGAGAGGQRSKAAVAPLTASLKDRNPEVRAAAATGLGKLDAITDRRDKSSRDERLQQPMCGSRPPGRSARAFSAT